MLAVPAAELAAVMKAAGDADVAAAEIGHAGGDRLLAPGAFDVALTDAHDAWSNGLPAALGLTAKTGA